MKKRLKVLLALSLLMVCMSSCVYSLFPIYTEERIVFLPELVGKWKLDGKNELERYVEFSAGIDLDATISLKKTDDNQEVQANESSKPKVTSSFEVTLEDIDEDDYIIIKGDTVRDPEMIRRYWQAEIDAMFGEEFDKDVSKAFDKMGEAFNKMGKLLNNISNPNPMKYSSSSKSYKMRLFDEGEVLDYEATLTLIGDDYFLDLYATGGDRVDLNMESRVWFPVHTFMKVELDGDRLMITEFDLQKMNKLFDSNLVRMRHENVDGTILITAQTDEIRKFLDKYSDDEKVFEKPEFYRKVAL